MSFIYARNFKNRIYVFADSKLSTSPNDEGQLTKYLGKEAYNSIKSLGVIKNVIINENICVASAGVLEDFNILLKLIDDKKISTLDEICNEALRIHCDNRGRTDFIIALCDIEHSKLFEIKNGKIEEVLISWIGVYECFKKFQEIKNTQSEKENLSLSNLDSEFINYINKTFLLEQLCDSKVFEEVVNSNVDNSVGGNIIECLGIYGKFVYKEKIYSYCEKPQEVKSGGVIRTCDNVFDGGYSCHVYESNDNYKMYILQLGKGIVFEPYISDENYSHLRLPKIYEMCEQDFIDKMK